MLHSSSSIPNSTIGLWLKLGLSNRFITEPQQPIFKSFAPITTLSILELIMAPAHMGQGSKVTYKVQSMRRQFFKFLLASFMANISAWPKGF